MGVAPRSWDQEGLVLQAPAQPNVNVHGTMFGGGIAALGILAGWGWLRLELDARGVDADVVVQDVRTRYLEPLRGDGLARCLPPDPGDLDRFFRTLRRRGRGRLGLRVEIGPDIAEQAAIGGVASPAAAAASSRAGSRGAEPVAIIEARFVAIGPP
jgi:thioesterase domain-containing protein